MARSIVDGLAGYRHPLLWVETLNELVKEQTAEHILFQREVASRLATAGYKTCGPSWATGAYEKETWEAWRAAGWPGCSLIALHGYWAGAGPTIYNALRWRQFWLPGDPQVVVTEAGRDMVRDGANGQYIGRGGWKRDGITADAYADEILRYGAELDQDDYVLGATIFSCGPTPDWAAFDADPIVERMPASLPTSPRRPAPPPPKPEAAMTTPGIDVSNHQGLVGWDAVAVSGQGFAFIKASEDPDYLDSWLARNWVSAKRVGLVRGAYCYARPSLASPAESVTLFQSAIEAVGGLETGDLIALDIEDENAVGDLSQWVAEWLDLAERTFGVRPIVYSGTWYMEPHGLLNPAFGRYPLWLASYQDEPPGAPTGWDRLTFWQRSASGRVSGVATDCDLDTFFGTVAELRALGLPAPAVEDAIERDVWGPLFALKDVAWELGRQELGQAMFDALMADKARLGR
mgnify:FL=1